MLTYFSIFMQGWRFFLYEVNPNSKQRIDFKKKHFTNFANVFFSTWTYLSNDLLYGVYFNGFYAGFWEKIKLTVKRRALAKTEDIQSKKDSANKVGLELIKIQISFLTTSLLVKTELPLSLFIFYHYNTNI